MKISKKIKILISQILLVSYSILFLINTKAATFEFSPSSDTLSFGTGCNPYSIDIYINALPGEEWTATDIKISYDSTKLNILRVDPAQDIVEFYETINPSTNTLRYAAGSFSQQFSGSTHLASIIVDSSISSLTSTQLNTIILDSNIAFEGDDILNQSSSAIGNYTLNTSNCAVDTSPPQVTFINPQNGDTSVTLDSNVTIRIRDNLSGFVTSSIQFNISGEVYRISDPEVTPSGGTINILDTTFIINPSINFPANQAVSIVVTGEDNSGNVFNRNIIFNIPEEPTPPSGCGGTCGGNQTCMDRYTCDQGICKIPECIGKSCTCSVPGCGGVCSANNPCSSNLTCDNGICKISECVGQSCECALPGCGESCIDGTICASGFICDAGTCKIAECNGRSCTCSTTLSKCSQGCGSDNDCEPNLICHNNACRIPSCAMYGDESCTCTPPSYDDIIREILIEKEKLIFVETPVGRVVTEIIIGQGDSITLFDDTILNDTLIETVVKEVGYTGTLASLFGFIMALSSIAPFLNTPGLIFNILGLLLLRKKTRKPWGIVVDDTKNTPVAFATCRLYKSGSTYLVNQTVTDLDGRYGFTIEPGNYRLEITHGNYNNFTKEIVIQKGESSYVYDVRLELKNLENDKQKFSQINKIKGKVANFYERIKPLIFIVGLSLSTLSVIINTNTLNLIILILYLLSIILITVSKLRIRAKYASVTDSITDLRIPYATVKIFDLKNGNLIDTQITNSNGNFDFWEDENDYALMVDIRGYKFPSERKNDFPVIGEGNNPMLKVHLTKGKNNITIYVDPITKDKNKNMNRNNTNVIRGNYEDNGKINKNITNPFEN